MASKRFENQRTASQIVKHRIEIIREEFVVVQIQVKIKVEVEFVIIINFNRWFGWSICSNFAF